MTTVSPDKDELLPCPFCGASEDGFRQGKTGCPKVEELSEGGWRVTCYTCRYFICWQPFASAADAITAWNNRAAMSPVDRLRALIVGRLVEAYRRDRVAVANLCDEQIDRSGNLLGWLREAALSSPEPVGEVDDDWA